MKYIITGRMTDRNNPRNYIFDGYYVTDYFKNGFEIFSRKYDSESAALIAAKAEYLGDDDDGIGVDVDIEEVSDDYRIEDRKRTDF